MNKGVAGKGCGCHAKQCTAAVSGGGSEETVRGVRLAAGLSPGRYRGPVWPQPLRWASPAMRVLSSVSFFRYFNIAKL